jgi:two-component system, chemotaxis family, sensor kinase CheA
MDRKDKELLKKLLPTFKIEAHEHLTLISSGLIEIEKADAEKRRQVVETIYRESHSLKGAARSVNLPDIVAICQSMENVFSAFKRKQITLSSQLIDLLHRTVDYTSKIIAGDEFSQDQKTEIKALVKVLEDALKKPDYASYGQEDGTGEPVGDAVASHAEAAEKEPQLEPGVQDDEPALVEAPATFVPSPQLSGTVRISAAKLDSLLLQTEEMLSIKLAAGQRADELKDLKNKFDLWKKENAARKSAGSILGLDRRRTEDGTDHLIAAFEPALNRLIREADSDQRSFGTMLDSLLDKMKQTLMLPFSPLLEIFPMLVRELMRDTGKEADLICEGGETKVDRRVLEEIKDPLIHLVRNCIGHGIERAADRTAKGKPSRGKIGIAVSSREGKIEIAVSDDGAGINTSEVKSAAERSGAISREEAHGLDSKDALPLVFRSGITTSPIITDISGRGLGLAIVRERVEKLNGTVDIDTKQDIGTTLKMVVPITIATFRGVLVRVGEHLFFLPSASIEKVARIRREEIQTVENRETLSLDGETVSFARLGAVLELRATDSLPQGEDPFIQIAVLRSAGKRMAFLVDEVLHEQEVLVKNLGPQLSRVRNIAGATLLGNGKVVPILNVQDLMISAVKVAPAPMGVAIGEPSKRVSVLVVEDSITARALLKTIIESAGWEVTTAVDGMDALTILKTREFDLVVSDIEMPRMDGFDLTARIRADRRLSEIPVVLVTALDSREDKERGIDVGANAYIVKSSFEQSNLLEVIWRLV